MQSSTPRPAYLRSLNVGVLAWSPLARGVLSGKYHGEGKADEQTGRSMAQVALAWLRHQTVPVIPIIGARKVSQLQDNLASLDLELSAEQLKSLDEASRIELGFPQSIYEREMVRAIRYGGIWDRLLL